MPRGRTDDPLGELREHFHELGFVLNRLPNGAGYLLSAPGWVGPPTKGELARQKAQDEATDLLADHPDMLDALAVDAQDEDE
jgi:hypothetical protein